MEILFKITSYSMVIFLNYFLIKKISIKHNFNIRLSYFITSFHFIFTLIFIINELTIGSDSGHYFHTFNEKVTGGVIFYPGQPTIFYYTIFFLEKIKLDFYSISLLFNLTGSLSLIFLANISLDFIKMKKSITGLLLISIIFLPSFNFWISGLSKDNLIIFLLSCYVFLLHKNRMNLLNFIVITLVIFLIRPYVAAFIFVSISLVTMVEIFFYKRKNIKNIIIAISSIVAGYTIYKLFFGIFSETSISIAISNLQNSYADTNLGISKDTNFLLRIINYMITPTLFHNTSGLLINIIKIENLYLTIILSYFLFQCLSNYKKINLNIGFNSLIIIFSGFVFLVVLATVTSNIGIVLRQKWMVIPFLLYTMHFFFSQIQKKKLN
jgi:hypothetical protein